MKRTREESRLDLAARYRRDLAAVSVSAALDIGPTWYSEAPVILDCREIPVDAAMRGLVQTGNRRYQFDCGKIKDGKRYRPVAYRVPFLADEHFFDEAYTVSHLCHNPVCCNPDHHVLEPLETNKARNGCPGGGHCHHRVKCLRPGPYHDT